MPFPQLVCEIMPGAGPFDTAGDKYLSLPGTDGSYASTPDHSSLDIVGDIDVRVEVTADDWTPAVRKVLCGKYDSTTNNRSWRLILDTTGALRLEWSADGVAVLSATSTAAVSPPASGRLAARATLDVDNTGGGTATPTVEAAKNATADSLVPTPPVTAPVGAGDLELRYAAGAGLAAGPWTPPSSGAFTERADLQSGNFTTGTLATRALTAGGSTGQHIFTANQASAQGHGVTVALAADDGGTYRSVSSVASGTTGAFNCAKPAGVVSGDILVAFHSCDFGLASAMGTPTGGATWLPLTTLDDGLNDLHTKVWWKVAGGSEPANYGFTQNSSGDGVVVIAAAFAPVGRVVTFSTAPAIGGAYTQLGDPVFQSGVTSIFNSAAPLEAGASNNGVPAGMLDPFAGRVHAAEVRSGIGGSQVANPNFAAQPVGTTSFADAAGRTWAVNGAAAVAGFDWADISSRLRAANWAEGRTNELDQFPPGQAQLTLGNHDRLFDPEHTAGAYFGGLLPRVPVRLQWDEQALDLPGANGDFASTADHPSLDIVGDIDVRVEVTADDWSPATTQVLAAKYLAAGDQRSWRLELDSAGTLTWQWSANGIAQGTLTSTANLASQPNGSRLAVRATFDVDNGSSGRTARFYTGPSIAGPWAQLGADVTSAGVTSLFSSTAPVELGACDGGVPAGARDPLAGLVHAAEVRNGIDGTIVAQPHFTVQKAATSSFADNAGRTWAANGTAAIAFHRRLPLYLGFVEDGWEQHWQPPKEATCTVTLVDMLGVLAALTLPASAYTAEVLADHPLAYWPLDETQGTQMGDSSGRGNHGLYDNGELGRDPLVLGGGQSFEVPAGTHSRGRFSGEPLPHGAPLTLEAWARFPRDLTASHTVVGVQRDFTSGFAVFFGVGTAAGGSPNGELQIWLAGGYQARGHTRVDDDVAHHVVATMASTAADDIRLYIDGVLQTKTVVSGSVGTAWPSSNLWTAGNLAQSVDAGLGGLLDDVAVYDHALSPERVTAHYQAGVTAFAGETAGARVNRVLDLVGVPAAARDIATGDTLAGPADYAGSSAGQYLAAVAEAEQGLLYLDHHSGKVAFRGRYTRLTSPRSTGSQATLTDLDGPAALHYERDGLDVDPNGIASIVNQVEVRWPGGTAHVSDPASTARYGPQSRSVTTEAPTAQAAADAGSWLISRYAQPQARARGLQLAPGADDRLFPLALDARVSDRLTVRRHPQTVGVAVTKDVWVEGVSHDVAGLRWATTLRLSAADQGGAWTWGTSQWDVDTVWG